MNKQFLIAWAVVFVLWMVGSFVVHGIVLNAEYAQLPNLFRTEEETQAYSHFMLLGHLIMAGAFVWIYRRGREAKPPVAQGLRFGIAIALLGPIPAYMIYYVVQPMPASLVIGQIIGDTILILILGVVVALAMRAPEPAAS